MGGWQGGRLGYGGIGDRGSIVAQSPCLEYTPRSGHPAPGPYPSTRVFPLYGAHELYELSYTLWGTAPGDRYRTPPCWYTLYLGEGLYGKKIHTPRGPYTTPCPSPSPSPLPLPGTRGIPYP